MSFKERYLEEAKRVYTPEEIRDAAGAQYIYTSDPDETWRDVLFSPVKGPIIHQDDLEYRMI